MNLSFRNRTDALVEAWRNAGKGLLIDVREPDEYAVKRLAGSVHLPLSQLNREAASAYIPYPDTPVFVYCLAGPRSALHADTNLKYRKRKFTFTKPFACAII